MTQVSSISSLLFSPFDSSKEASFFGRRNSGEVISFLITGLGLVGAALGAAKDKSTTKTFGGIALLLGVAGIVLSNISSINSKEENNGPDEIKLNDNTNSEVGNHARDAFDASQLLKTEPSAHGIENGDKGDLEIGVQVLEAPGLNDLVSPVKLKRMQGSVGDLISNIEGLDDALAMQSIYELMCRYLLDGQKLDAKVTSTIVNALKLDQSSLTAPRISGFLAGVDKYKPGTANVTKHMTNRENLSMFQEHIDAEFARQQVAASADKNHLLENYNQARKLIITRQAITRNQIRSALNENDGYLQILRMPGKRSDLIDNLRSEDAVVAMESMHELVCRFMLDGQKLSDNDAQLIIDGLLLDVRGSEHLVDDKLLHASELESPRFEGFIKALDKVEATSDNEKHVQVRRNLAKLSAIAVRVMISAPIPHAKMQEPKRRREVPFLGRIETSIDHKRGQVVMARRSDSRRAKSNAAQAIAL